MKEKGESAFDDVVSGDSGTGQDAKNTDGDSKESNGGASRDTTKSSSAENRTESNETPVDDVSESEPEFPFAEVDQHPVYTRPDTWKSLEDAKYYAEGKLREEHGVRNVATRELDEVIAQLVVEELSPEQIAERVVELRGFDP